MTTVLDEIPEPLRADVDAALAWWNARESGDYSVTGIVDPPAAPDPARPLQLVLCGAGTCRQESFRVAATPEGAQVEWLGERETAEGAAVAELDPPPGARRDWLETVMGRHAFVVLVFYRGFW